MAGPMTASNSGQRAGPEGAFGDRVVGEAIEEGLVVVGRGEGEELIESFLADAAGDVGAELGDHALGLGGGEFLDQLPGFFGVLRFWR